MPYFSFIGFRSWLSSVATENPADSKWLTHLLQHWQVGLLNTCIRAVGSIGTLADLLGFESLQAERESTISNRQNIMFKPFSSLE